MKPIILALLVASIVTGATAQTTQPKGPTEYTLTVSTDDINLIGTAINELPAKIANPLSQRLLVQIQAQQKAFEDSHKAKGEEAAPAKQ